jgi:tRNA pseudouridine55 synthase
LESVSHDFRDRIHYIKKFIGTYQQKIPNFSAHKKEGKNFYELARNNEDIEDRYKQVSVSSLKVLYSNPSTLGIELECQTGFYVRAFASELASSMGDKGYASHIKRLNIGEFSMDRSVNYENILDFSSINDLSTNLITI